MYRFKEKEFIEKFNKHCNGKYRYISYENGLVSFFCNKHGVVDYDTPGHLLTNRGCKLCGEEKRRAVNEAANEKAKKDFKEKAKAVHGDKYDYSKVEYEKSSKKVCIICPKHGEFWQTPNSHLNGRGCKECSCEETHIKQKKTNDEFIHEAIKVHGDKYDYSKVKYSNCKTKVCIICPEHGEFWQMPNKHLSGQGCPKCAQERLAKGQTLTTESFIERAKMVHGDKYDYSKVDYKSYDEPVCIICPEHGEFWQTPDSHLQGSGCQMCSRRLSKSENEIYQFVSDKLGCDKVEKSNNTILDKHNEIDILIPSLKLAIEYNGCRWHSEQFGKQQNYHLNKTLMCKEKGISLIHIFEDEYKEKKEVVLSKIAHLIGCGKLPKIYGRKCVIKHITYKEAKEFLDKNHIQGGQKATVYLGAYYNDKLIGVMTFIKTNNIEWELNRYASDINFICCGVGGKLFSHFVKEYDPSMIKSFADRRYTTNENDNLYTKLGFHLDDILKPDYKYVMNGSYERIHKFNFRKNIIHKKYGLPLEMTESKMAEAIGAYKIWDCGLYKYVWKK